MKGGERDSEIYGVVLDGGLDGIGFEDGVLLADTVSIFGWSWRNKGSYNGKDAASWSETSFSQMEDAEHTPTPDCPALVPP